MPRTTSAEVLHKLLKLKNTLGTNNINTANLSIPILRSDSAKAASLLKSLWEQLLNLKMQVIDHSNVKQNHLGVREFHLKEKAVSR